MKKGFIAALPRRFLALILALAGLTVFYVLSVMISPGEDDNAWAVREDAAPITALRAVNSADSRELAQALGAALPVLADYTPLSGEARNAAHGAAAARLVTLTYHSGAKIAAVRPASAAPLLLRQGLAVSDRADLVCLNMPAMLAVGDNACCLYFSDDSAAYSFYMEGVSQEQFLTLAGGLTALRVR